MTSVFCFSDPKKQRVYGSLKPLASLAGRFLPSQILSTTLPASPLSSSHGVYSRRQWMSPDTKSEAAVSSGISGYHCNVRVRARDGFRVETKGSHNHTPREVGTPRGAARRATPAIASKKE